MKIFGRRNAVDETDRLGYELQRELRMNAVPDVLAGWARRDRAFPGIWRGFRELVSWGLLDRIPRMVAVELGGAVASALASGKDWVAPTGYVESPARALAGVTGTVQTLHAVVESEGLVVRVSDAELEQARMQMGELEGAWIDLASAAPIAAVIKLAQRGDVPARTVVVAIVTEHGIHDESSVAAGTLETVDGRVDDLLRVLAVRGE